MTQRAIVQQNRKEDAYDVQGMNNANEFTAGAELYRLGNQNKMAAIMFHRAAEHTLNMFLKKATGLHVNTLNINKLVGYCTMMNYKIGAIFRKEGERNRKSIALLPKSYIDTRYREDFAVSSKELALLTDKIKELQHLVEGVLGNNKMQ